MASYADAVVDFVAAAEGLQAWPECCKALVEGMSREPSWLLALPGLSCLAVGGSPIDALPVAAATAALGLAAQILDAVQDGDDLPALGLDNPAAATNLATGLIFIGFQFLSRASTQPGTVQQLTALFSEAAFQAAMGQGLDLLQDDAGVSPMAALEAYWHRVALKSGSQLRAAAAGGAAMGTDDERAIAALGAFGNGLGVVLQVLDDCRDALDGTDDGVREISLPLLLLALATEEQGKEISLGDAYASLSQARLREADVPALIAEVLTEWRQRALASLEAVENAEAAVALEAILEHVLTTQSEGHL